MSRRYIFDAVKRLRGGQPWTDPEIKILDEAIDAYEGVIGKPITGMRATQRIIDFIHGFESLELTAYPDPGSRDGKPWTIGWGSTGPDIVKGLVWTREQADARFKQHFAKLEQDVVRVLGGAPTTQDQFDALMSFAYNVGVTALAGSTLLKLHRVGDYDGAAKQFARWNKNDGKTMAGLTRRRLVESLIYRGES
jgi:lysozyme